MHELSRNQKKGINIFESSVMILKSKPGVTLHRVRAVHMQHGIYVAASMLK
jgi:hypothetical protein